MLEPRVVLVEEVGAVVVWVLVNLFSVLIALLHVIDEFTNNSHVKRVASRAPEHQLLSVYHGKLNPLPVSNIVTLRYPYLKA